MTVVAATFSCEPAQEGPPPAPDQPPPGMAPEELVKNGRFAEAERLLQARLNEERADATDATRARTHHLLALALSSQGRFDAALGEIQLAARMADQNPEVHRAFGNILLKRGEAARAVVRYRRALELAESFRGRTSLEVPDLHRWRYELAQALLELGREEEARAELALYERQQRSEIMLRNLERTAEDQRTPTAYFEYAIALREAGRIKNAASALRTALQMDPSFAQAHVALSSVLAGSAVESPSYARPALLELSARHAREALALDESPEAWLALGRAERMRGNVDASEDAIEKALMLSGGGPGIEDRIAELREIVPGPGSP